MYVAVKIPANSADFGPRSRRLIPRMQPKAVAMQASAKPMPTRPLSQIICLILALIRNSGISTGTRYLKTKPYTAASFGISPIFEAKIAANIAQTAPVTSFPQLFVSAQKPKSAMPNKAAATAKWLSGEIRLSCSFVISNLLSAAFACVACVCLV